MSPETPHFRKYFELIGSIFVKLFLIRKRKRQ